MRLRCGDVTEPTVARDRGFESGSLQRRVKRTTESEQRLAVRKDRTPTPAHRPCMTVQPRVNAGTAVLHLAIHTDKCEAIRQLLRYV